MLGLLLSGEPKGLMGVLVKGKLRNEFFTQSLSFSPILVGVGDVQADGV